MVKNEHSLARISTSRRGLFRGTRDVVRGVLAKPTRGLEVVMQVGQKIVSNPDWPEKAFDAAKTAYERFQTTPQPYSPDWNFGVVVRLNQWLGDPEGLAEFGEALVRTRRDIAPAEKLLQGLMKSGDGGELELSTLYAQAGDFEKYDASVRKWCAKPGERVNSDGAYGDEWAEVLLKNAPEKANAGIDPMPDIHKAMELLQANKWTHPVNTHARVDLAYYDSFDRHNPDWLFKVNDGLRNYDGELGYGAHRHAFELFLEVGETDRAKALLPELERDQLISTLDESPRQRLIKILLEKDPTEALEVIDEGVKQLERAKEHRRNPRIAFVAKIEEVKFNILKEVTGLPYGNQPDLSGLLDGFFQLNTVPSIYSKVGKFAVEAAVREGLDAKPLVQQVLARVKTRASEPLSFSLSYDQQDYKWDGPELTFGYALDDVVDMQLAVGDIRGAHSTYKRLAEIHERTDQFAYELPKDLVKIARAEAIAAK